MNARAIGMKRSGKLHGKCQTKRRPVPSPLSFGFTLTTVFLLVATTLLAATALWPIYRSSQLVLVVGVTMLTGSTIALFGAICRWSALTLTLLTVALYLIMGVPLAIPDRASGGLLPTLDGELELLRATALSWKQLLTISLPVGSYRALLVPAVILVLATVVIGLSVGLRARRGELGAIAPIALFALAILFGPTTATRPLVSTLALLVGVLGWSVWGRWYRRRAAIRSLLAQAQSQAPPPAQACDGRPKGSAAKSNHAGFQTIVGATITVALAVGGAITGMAYFAPTAPRQVLRSVVEQPFDPRVYPSPLNGFRQYQRPDVSAATMLTITGLQSGGRIRIATLDGYDGVVYSVGASQVAGESGSFTRVPWSLDQSGVAGSPVTIQVTVGDYSGVFLPTVGALTGISFTGAHADRLQESFFYNNTSGAAILINALTRGDSYSLTAVYPFQPADSLLAAVVPRFNHAQPAVTFPDRLASTLEEWSGSETTPGTRLVAMIAAIKHHGFLSHGVDPKQPASRSGHSADRITQLLTDQPMIGDEEQYAVTAALMARKLGFPARVVFGFVPEITATGPTRVLGKNISAWIEVNTVQYGWVTIDPTPAVRDIPSGQTTTTSIAHPQVAAQLPVDETARPNPEQPAAGFEQRQTADGTLHQIVLTVATALGWLLAGTGIALAPFGLIVAAKRRRRMLRRTAPTAAGRISGGWQEFDNAVRDHGYAIPDCPTRLELAANTGGPSSFLMATIADRAVFSPEQARDEDADQVWRALAVLRSLMNFGLTRRQRLRAATSLRSFGGYSRRKLFRK